MNGVLLVVDGTEQAESAVWEVVAQARQGAIGTIHLLNLQPAFDGLVRHFVGMAAIRAFQRDAGEAALAGARQILECAGLAYEIHIRSGDAVRHILRLAQELDVGQIVLSSGSDGLIDTFLQRLLVARVIRRSSVPIVVARAQGGFHEFDVPMTPPTVASR
ncbi:MAG TPA: universal stress protein [Alphaproteobacteria bacterium]